MKKFVRVVTLMLVLVMAVSVLAIPAAASAAYTETCSVEPRKPVLRCVCGGTLEYVGKVNGRDCFVCDTCGRVVN